MYKFRASLTIFMVAAINMAEIAKTLLEINYDKPITLEAINSVRKNTLENDLLFKKVG